MDVNHKLSEEGSLLTIDQVAERLGVKKAYVRRLTQEKRIPYLKVGHFVRFRPEDIEAFIVRVDAVAEAQ